MAEKKKQRYFSLQPSERAVYEAASRIYAAYIAAGKKTDANQRDLMRLSLREALTLGLTVEDRIQSDDELEDIT
jgi:hypothetical protein